MNLSYAIWLSISGAVALVVAGFAWRRRPAPGAASLATLMLVMSIWTLTYAVFWLATSSSAKYFWLNATYFGVVFVPVVFFVFVLEYAGHAHWLPRRGVGYLLVLPVLTLLFLWTDPLHGLFFAGLRRPEDSVLMHGGPWFWLNVVYSYSLVVIGFVMILRKFVTAIGVYRSQAGIILVGALLPLIGNLSALLEVSPVSDLDVTPILFTATGVLFAQGLFGYRMLDLIPISRDTLIETMDEGILVLDLQGRVVDINPAAMAYADRGAVSPIGKPVREVYSTWGKFLKKYSAIFEAHDEIVLNGNPPRYLDVRIKPLRDLLGRVTGRLVTWRDITEQKLTERQLRKFFLAVEHSPASIVITDAEGVIEYVNPQFTEMTGFTAADAIGNTPRILKSGETQNEVYEDLWTTILSGREWQGELLNRRKTGDLYWEFTHISPVLDEQGVITHFIAIKEDITKRRRDDAEIRAANARLEINYAEIQRLHAQLREEAIRDSLTRLFNRRYMEETLERELSRAERERHPLSLVMIDVDEFKYINDHFGHRAGDAVLQTLGTLLLENTRISDVACRYGGDEMLVVMPSASFADALQRAHELRSAFSVLGFTFGEVTHSTTLSLGVASFPDHGRNPNELLGAADRALYIAKAKRNAVCGFDPESMTRHPGQPSVIS